MITDSVTVYLSSRRQMLLIDCPRVAVVVRAESTLADVVASASLQFVQQDPTLGEGQTLTSHPVAVHRVLEEDASLFYDTAAAILFGMDDDGVVVFTNDPGQMLYRFYARAESEVDRGFDPARLVIGRDGGSGGAEFAIVDIVSWLNDTTIVKGFLGGLGGAVAGRLIPGKSPKWLTKEGRHSARAGRVVEGLLEGREVDAVQVEEWFRRRTWWDEEVVAKHLGRTTAEARWLLTRIGYARSEEAGLWRRGSVESNRYRQAWVELLNADIPQEFRTDWS